MKEYGTFEDFYNLFKNWSKKDILRRTYDIAQESIQKENIIKEVREYIEKASYFQGNKALNEKDILEILDKVD